MNKKIFIDYIKERLSTLECFFEDIDGTCKCVLCKDARRVIKKEIRKMKKDIEFFEMKNKKQEDGK